MNRPDINEIKKAIVEMVNTDYHFNRSEFHCETNLKVMRSVRVDSKDGKTGTAELVYRYPVGVFA